jgi:hypothetical protein
MNFDFVNYRRGALWTLILIANQVFWVVLLGFGYGLFSLIKRWMA